jgi:hypothetical protein
MKQIREGSMNKFPVMFTLMSLSFNCMSHDNLCESTMHLYFPHSTVPHRIVTPHLRRVLSVLPEELESGELHSLMLSAITEAFQQQDKEIEKHRKESEKKWSKIKASSCAAVTGIISALITAGAALAIHFTTNGNCP